MAAGLADREGIRLLDPLACVALTPFCTEDEGILLIDPLDPLDCAALAALGAGSEGIILTDLLDIGSGPRIDGLRMAVFFGNLRSDFGDSPATDGKFALRPVAFELPPIGAGHLGGVRT